MSPAFVTGFVAEAQVARRSGWSVGVGGGSSAGAAAAARRLIRDGATGLVSFGLAGGLDPDLPAGTVVVADSVIADGQTWRTDAGLSARLGQPSGLVCLGWNSVVDTVAEKRLLRRDTGAALVDMESGAVAMEASGAGIPFAVLRAICDPADRALPPAALVALDGAGRLTPGRIAWSVARHPGQIGMLLALGRDAALARRALRDRVDAIHARNCNPR